MMEEPFIKQLPPEIFVLIFQCLDYRDALKNCSLVCKMWHHLLTGDLFWKYLLTYEFNSNIVTKIQIDAFRRAVTSKFSLASQSGQLSGIIQELKCDCNLCSTPLRFIEQCLSSCSLEFLNNIKIGIAYSKSKGHWWLVNLTKIIPGTETIFDVLKIPMVFAIDSDLGNAVEMFSVIFLDFSFHVVHKVKRTGIEKNYAIVSNYPVGVRYLAFRDDWSCGVRLVLPSDAKKLHKKIELMESASNGNVEQLCSLLESGIDLNTCKDRHGQCALILAASTGQYESIPVLVRNWGAAVNARDKDGNTALMRSITPCPFKNVQRDMNDQFLTIKKLVECGADVATLNDAGKTVLHMAAFDQTVQHQRRIANVKCLIENGANIDQRDADGNTILMVAVTRRRSREARSFINLKANVDARNNNNEIPLLMAVKSGDVVMINLLIKSGANVNAQVGKLTVLNQAVFQGNLKIVQTLLSHGADPKIKDEHDFSALDYAAQSSDQRMTVALTN